MPFESKNEIELNFLWFGGSCMPDDQLVNLMGIIADNPEILINIWVDRPTYNAIGTALKAKITDFNKQREKDGKAKMLWKNVRFRETGKEPLQIPSALESLIQRTIKAKLWSGLSDIYRLLVLTRKESLDKSRPVRFYVEADDSLSPDLWQRFAGNDIACMYHISELNPHVKLPQEVIAPDFIMFDIRTPRGEGFCKQVRDHLTKFFTDKLIASYFVYLTDQAADVKNPGLNFSDIGETYGSTVASIMRMHFMTEKPDDVHGMRDMLFHTDELKPLRERKRISKDSSWNTSVKPALDNGAFLRFFMLRMIELTYPGNTGLNSLLERLKLTRDEFMGLLFGRLRASYASHNTWPECYKHAVIAYTGVERQPGVAATSSKLKSQ